ncbi:MAG: hypothetical protein KDB66_04820 [Solirubrobacterales bacterium]|nr:hypothetical protein [Solirubrobacterales bacterium]
MSSAESKNLEAISKAIDHHNATCPFPAAEVRMNPFEVERLGWEEIRGLPVVPDPDIGTGRFHIVCSRDMDGDELEEVEAIGEDLVTVTPGTREESGSPEPVPGPAENPGRWN